MLPPRDSLDVYIAFRQAFLKHPSVRIFTREPREVSNRFVQTYATPCRVFIYDEDSGDPDRNTPREVPMVASVDGPAYRDVAHWADTTRASWEREPVGVVGGLAYHGDDLHARAAAYARRGLT